jgi:hypothetical protein
VPIGDAPRTLAGSVADGTYGALALDLYESVPSLMYPMSVQTYSKMRFDPQIHAVLNAYTLPLRAGHWVVNPAGCRDEVVQLCADAWGLPIMGNNDGPGPFRRRGVLWDDHLRVALLMLPFGHSPFAIRYDVTGTPMRARLAELSERLPQTITDIVTNDDGSLKGIQQASVRDTIPAKSLLWYVHNKEGAAWQGQALPLDTPIATPDGWTTMGGLEVGSRLFDETGRICHVVARSPVWRSRPCFRVTFSDGSSLIADENHLWESHTYKARHHGHEPSVVTTAEMAATMHYGTGRRQPLNHAVVKPGPLQYVRQDQLIDPYVLGAWLGDGTSLAATVTSASWDAGDLAALMEERGYPTKTIHNGAPDGNGRLVKIYGDLQSRLRALGLIGNKHIPDGYLRGSIAQRIDLLCGLMDTDGSSSNGRCEFSNTNRDLVDGVAILVRSLGCHASIAPIKRNPDARIMGKPVAQLQHAWRVCFSPTFTPFRLSRKVDHFERGPRRQRGKAASRALGPRQWRVVTAIESVEPVDTVCIEVDSPSHLFLAGHALIPTHNSMIRPAYAPWLLKHELWRVLATSSRRFGMGVPTVTAPTGGTPSDINAAAELAAGYRAGDQAGIGLPDGFRFDLAGLNGSVPDTLGFVRYLDQQIATSCLASVMNLDTSETGNRALGDTLISLLELAWEATAREIAVPASRMNVQMVDYNWGEDEPVPAIMCAKIPRQAVSDAVAGLVTCGALTPDLGMENELRDVYRLPQIESRPTPVQQTPPTGTPSDAPTTTPGGPGAPTSPDPAAPVPTGTR